MTVCSSSPQSASETDNEQTQDSAQNAAFSSEKFYDLQHEADYTGSEDEAQYSMGTEDTALPRPAWMDSSSQDGSTADARVQSIRDIIRVSDRTFKHCVMCIHVFCVFFVHIRMLGVSHKIILILVSYLAYIVTLEGGRGVVCVSCVS